MYHVFPLMMITGGLVSLVSGKVVQQPSLGSGPVTSTFSPINDRQLGSQEAVDYLPDRSSSTDLPYEMVAHSNFNNRLLFNRTIPANRDKFTDSSMKRRTRHTPGVSHASSSVGPSRYYDSYGDWHGGATDQGHQWPHLHSHYEGHQHHQHHQHSSWPWKPPTFGAIDCNGSLLSLQLTLLQPLMLLGTLSFVVCLVNALLGLVDKVKLPSLRSQDEQPVGLGLAGTPAGPNELLLGHLYQILGGTIGGGLAEQHMGNGTDHALYHHSTDDNDDEDDEELEDADDGGGGGGGGGCRVVARNPRRSTLITGDR
ncbi:hypothetical protein AND_004684 [Anopheles darlingi]|uniref:Uncharacterized protein n=1 Tax=Anopheles darlingi TaxID=43151 RepID=W5JHM7_ANODA|nr:hypothetical protein AND_004684 [Anopheles darlingi]